MQRCSGYQVVFCKEVCLNNKELKLGREGKKECWKKKVDYGGFEEAGEDGWEGDELNMYEGRSRWWGVQAMWLRDMETWVRYVPFAQNCEKDTSIQVQPA